MKRKTGLTILALAAPVAGLALVWRAGQRSRDEVDVCEAALRAIVPQEVAKAPVVFLSIHKQDPPQILITRFGDSTPPVVPLSQFATKLSLITPDQIAMAALNPSPSVALDIVSLLWESNNRVRMDIDATGPIPFFHCTLLLKRQGNQWKVAARTGPSF